MILYACSGIPSVNLKQNNVRMDKVAKFLTVCYLAPLSFSFLFLPRRQKNYPVDFDNELKIGEVRYDDMT